MDPVEPPRRDAPLDHAVRQADLEELRDRDDAMLLRGEGGYRNVEPIPPPVNGVKSTSGVDFLPGAGHGRHRVRRGRADQRVRVADV
jgi:hypothetical protein